MSNIDNTVNTFCNTFKRTMGDFIDRLNNNSNLDVKEFVPVVKSQFNLAFVPNNLSARLTGIVKTENYLKVCITIDENHRYHIKFDINTKVCSYKKVE